MEKGVAIIADSCGKGYYFAQGVYEYIKNKDDRDFPIKLVDINRIDFEDGEFKIKIESNIREKRCFFIHDANKEPSIWFSELGFSLDAIKYSSPSKIEVLLPYMRYSRQDRKDESRVGVSAKVVAKLISKYADGGMTIDLHAPQIQQYFDIPFDNLYSYPTLIRHLEEKHSGILENLVIVPSDEGGAKNGRSLRERIEKKLRSKGINLEVGIAFGSKRRTNKGLDIEIIGDVKGKNCLIPDDQISTGETMIAAGNVLRTKGVEKILCYATHPLFTRGIDGFEIFDSVLIGDTLRPPTAPNIEVASMIPLMGEAVFRRINGESISELYQN